jgi:hypothetical protein
MKTITSFSFLLFLSFWVSPELNAQGHDFEKRMERLNVEKIAFFTQKLQLTSEEAEKFWPVYNAFQKEKTENQKNKINLERTFRNNDGTLSDKEIEKLADDYISYLQTDADLSTKYHQKFKKVLPIQKVMKLYQAENQYKAMLLKRLRNQREMNKTRF